MPIAQGLSSLVPDRRPTWLESLSAVTTLVALASITFGSAFEVGVSAVAVGFVPTAVALGPVAASPFGAWLRRVTSVGGGLLRVLLTVLATLALWGSLSWGFVPPGGTLSALLGAALALVAVVVARMVLARWPGGASDVE